MAPRITPEITPPITFTSRSEGYQRSSSRNPGTPEEEGTTEKGDRTEGARSGPATFVVRLFSSDAGQVDGVVERLRTGEKRRVRSLKAVGHVIEQMLGRETGESPPTIAGQRRAPARRSKKEES